MHPAQSKPEDSGKIVVKSASLDQLSGWDVYVDRHEDATFFHRSGWYRVIQESFGHTPHYLLAMDTGGNIRGILPLFEVKSFLFGHYLVSVPFCVYGGAVSDSPEIRALLEDEAAKLATELNVDYLELRYREKSRDDWPSRSLHATFTNEIADDEESILLSIKNKQRAVIRKSLKNDLTCILQADVGDFFHVYSTSVRNLGTPVFGKNYFDNLRKEFGSDCEIVSIRQGGTLHCSLISFYFKNQVLPFYGGGLPVSRNSKAMDFMYYDLMCRARREGYEIFDFGRSKNESGPYNYKRHWGFEAQPLHYQYFLVGSDELPELNTANPRYQTMISLWRKLPLGISQLLGPRISRYLG